MIKAKKLTYKQSKTVQTDQIQKSQKNTSFQRMAMAENLANI